MNQRPQNFFLFLGGGALLSATAGFIDASTILAPGHLAVSHVTGSVSQLAITAVEATTLDSTLVLAGIFAFILGAALSGAIIRSTQLQLGRRYGIMLALEGVLLAMASWLLIQGQNFGVVLAALGCGLQNGMATQYSGAIVRTTHITGLATDIGIAIGAWAARRQIEGWRIILHLSLAISFVFGAIQGAAAYHAVGGLALLGPAALTGTLGIIYFTWAQTTGARI